AGQGGRAVLQTQALAVLLARSRQIRRDSNDNSTCCYKPQRFPSLSLMAFQRELLTAASAASGSASRLTKHTHFFKAGDLLRHPALKLVIGALEERPHDRMGRAIVEPCVGIRRVDGWSRGDRIAACPFRQLREGFQDRPFALLIDRDF